MAARKDAQMTGEKQSIVFTNTYDPAETPTQPADPGDNGDSSGDGGNSSGNDNSQTTPAQDGDHSASAVCGADCLSPVRRLKRETMEIQPFGSACLSFQDAACC